MNATREQLLISRLAGGEAMPQEWQEVERLAESNPSLWRDLALAHRDQAALESAVGRAIDAAKQVNLPFDHVNVGSEASPTLQFRRVSAWSGWAVAALVAIVSAVSFHAPAPQGLVPPQTAGVSFASAADALTAYLQKGMESGEVVGELESKLLLDTRPMNGQGYEVIYLRQIMERTVVPDLYQWSGEDESGHPIFIRYEPAMSSSL